MKLLFCGLLLTCILFAEGGFQPLFNGKNLDDWDIDTPGLWTVRDGVIIGKSPGLNYHDYLRTKKQYSDFVLRVKMRIIDGRGNSGIQFRSWPVPNRPHQVEGPQADAGILPIVGPMWGHLYCEYRQSVLAPLELSGPRAARPTAQRRIDPKYLPADPAVLRKLTVALFEGKVKPFGTDSRPLWYKEFLEKMDPAAWHEYVITAQGNHIVYELDGLKTVDYYENNPTIAKSGIIALQLHGGREPWDDQIEPMEVHFKDLSIKILPATATSNTNKTAALYRINAGGPACTDSLGQFWDADGHYNAGSLDVTTNTIMGTADPMLYQTERYGPPKPPELKYTLPVSNRGNYRVRLHFAETYIPTKAVGARVFDVQIEGKLAFDNLDIFAEAGPDKALMKTYDVEVADGALNIDFLHVVENPKVNAIEVIDLTGKKP